MIRGAIEVVETGRVAGWIFSSAESLRDKLIMAFIGTRCAGTGKVDRFRKDLLEAKLGDGYCGFDFPVRLLPGEKTGSLVVRLQNSDAALLQASSRVFGENALAPDEDAAPDLGAVPPGSVSWMQDHGWLEQHEHDFLRAIQTAGAYERGLRSSRASTQDHAAHFAKPEIVVRQTLGVYLLAHVDVTRTHVTSFADIAAATDPLNQNSVSVIGLWSEEHTSLSVMERSHIGPRAQRGRLLADPPAGGIDYQFGPDRVLFLHRDCSFAPYGPVSAAGIALFTAAPKSQKIRHRPAARVLASVKAA